MILNLLSLLLIIYGSLNGCSKKTLNLLIMNLNLNRPTETLQLHHQIIVVISNTIRRLTLTDSIREWKFSSQIAHKMIITGGLRILRREPNGLIMISDPSQVLQSNQRLSQRRQLYKRKRLKTKKRGQGHQTVTNKLWWLWHPLALVACRSSKYCKIR
jgi:hypothetical protein